VQHPGNEVDSQEPDGSLGFYSTKEKTTRVVIELKDAMTSLDKSNLAEKKDIHQSNKAIFMQLNSKDVIG